jgi:hypothetical protein
MPVCLDVMILYKYTHNNISDKKAPGVGPVFLAAVQRPPLYHKVYFTYHDGGFGEGLISRTS